jgi:SpoVK/Ycf46/Vps4 family AAA+-type ATPase
MKATAVLANELGRDVHRVDLGQVVSRYVGETEKNLTRVFDEAQRAGAVLFFDEADALFGKRTDVKDAHDRYANLDISYLLERLEEYEGLMILATNRRENVDDAFIRRIRYVVSFE